MGMKLDYGRSDAGRFWRRLDPRRHPRLAILAALAALLGSLWLFFPGLFYSRGDEVDIRSGRIRHSHCLLRIPVSRSISASALSNAMPTTAPAVDQPDWHTVTTFEGGIRRSPHYAYHDAIAQMRRIEVLWQMVAFTPEAKRQVAATVLALWQNAGDDGDAGRYIRSVEELASEADKSRRIVDVAQLDGQISSTRPARR